MPATIERMPRTPSPEGESKKDKSEPVRIDRTLLRIIRILAPLDGLTAPGWIEKHLKVAARRAMKNAPDQFKAILESIDADAD